MRRSKLLWIAVAMLPVAVIAAEIEVSFVDPAWDGETVPAGQQCQKFGGQGESPALLVTGVPAAADLLTLDFSDGSYAAMDKGGHGKIAYRIELGAGTVTIPSVAGHTMDLPDGFEVVEAHQAPTWDKAGAYLPPCSGGRGNRYYVTVRAVHRAGEELQLLAEAVVEMGKY